MAEDQRNNGAYVLVFGLLAALVISVISLINLPHGASPASPYPDPSGAPATPARQPTPSPGPWSEHTEAYGIDGETKIVASTGNSKQYFVARLIGRKLECFLNTDKFLETTDNMESGISPVRFRFDGGPIIRQGWSLSADHEALFVPGCASFIEKLIRATSLVVEFKPADEIAQTIDLEVSQFPEDMLANIRKLRRATKTK